MLNKIPKDKLIINAKGFVTQLESLCVKKHGRSRTFDFWTIAEQEEALKLFTVTIFCHTQVRLLPPSFVNFSDYERKVVTFHCDFLYAKTRLEATLCPVFCWVSVKMLNGSKDSLVLRRTKITSLGRFDNGRSYPMNRMQFEGHKNSKALMELDAHLFDFF